MLGVLGLGIWRNILVSTSPWPISSKTNSSPARQPHQILDSHPTTARFRQAGRQDGGNFAIAVGTRRGIGNHRNGGGSKLEAIEEGSELIALRPA